MDEVTGSNPVPPTIFMNKLLSDLGLSSSNSIIIGSGILGALGIRKSNDVDVVTTEAIYDVLKSDRQFQVSDNHGEVLVKEPLEVRTSWHVLDKDYRYEDFLPYSVIIQGIRYITPEFLLKAKKSWVNDNPRPKDIEDIDLLEKYLGRL